MTESDLSKAMQRWIAKLWGPGEVFWHRVENTAALGTFDSFVGASWGSGWLELKICGPEAAPDMRPGQPGFGERCHRAGVLAHVLCCSDNGQMKLVDGRTTGSDWRDRLVARGKLDSDDDVRRLLLLATSPRWAFAR